MTDEKWEQLVERLLGQFPELERFREDMVESGEIRGFKDVLEFEGPAGLMQVVRESRPVVLEKVFHYSQRSGDTAKTDYKYSDTEYSHKLKIYRDVDGEWEEMSSDGLGL